MYAGLGIYDTMQFIPCDVQTVCFGMAASMGAFLLGAGTKGKRKSLPNARIMIHQPLGGAQGQAQDIEIQASVQLLKKSLGLGIHWGVAVLVSSGVLSNLWFLSLFLGQGNSLYQGFAQQVHFGLHGSTSGKGRSRL